MGQPYKVSNETILDALQYQGFITISQGEEYFFGEKSPANNRTANSSLDRLTRTTITRPKVWLMRGTSSRPWQNKGTGRPEAYYMLTNEGAKELLRITGVEITPSSNSIGEKSKQHALALVDIAIALRKKGAVCKCNRQVNIKGNENKPDTHIRPDIQYYFSDNPNKIQFIEYEHARGQKELEKIIFGRMEKWAAFLTSPEGENYSKNILVLFWFGKGETDPHTYEVWMKALYKLKSEKYSDGLPFTIYFKDFGEWIEAPTTDINEFTCLVPAEDPKQKMAEMQREALIKSAAVHCFTDLHEKSAIEKVGLYKEDKLNLFIKMQNTPARQKYFFNMVLKLHQIILSTTQKEGYGKAAIPWPAIGMVGYWLGLPEMAPLRESLSIAITEVQTSFKIGTNQASEAMERMVWNTLFRFFNFAKGGPLSFHAEVGFTDQKTDHANGVFPCTKIEKKGIFEEETDAQNIASAIDWLVALLINYQSELCLLKENKQTYFHSILTDSMDQLGIESQISD